MEPDVTVSMSPRCQCQLRESRSFHAAQSNDSRASQQGLQHVSCHCNHLFTHCLCYSALPVAEIPIWADQCPRAVSGQLVRPIPIPTRMARGRVRPQPPAAQKVWTSPTSGAQLRLSIKFRIRTCDLPVGHWFPKGQNEDPAHDLASMDQPNNRQIGRNI